MKHTELDLDAAQALCDVAMPGPWFVIKDKDGCIYVDSHDDFICQAFAPGVWKNRGNAPFIAKSREIVPALIAEVRRLRIAQDERIHELECEIERIKLHYDADYRESVQPQ